MKTLPPGWRWIEFGTPWAGWFMYRAESTYTIGGQHFRVEHVIASPLEESKAVAEIAEKIIKFEQGEL